MYHLNDILTTSIYSSHRPPHPAILHPPEVVDEQRAADEVLGVDKRQSWRHQPVEQRRAQHVRQPALELVPQVRQQRHVDGRASQEQAAHQALTDRRLVCPHTDGQVRTVRQTVRRWQFQIHHESDGSQTSTGRRLAHSASLLFVCDTRIKWRTWNDQQVGTPPRDHQQGERAVDANLLIWKASWAPSVAAMPAP